MKSFALCIVLLAPALSHADIPPSPAEQERLDEEAKKTCKTGELRIECSEMPPNYGLGPSCAAYRKDAAYYKLASLRRSEVFCKKAGKGKSAGKSRKNRRPAPSR